MSETSNKSGSVNRLSIIPLSIEKELKTSFLDYAMSVIVSRALPDVRDGLKPVHRRILYAMHTLGLYHERAYRKSATVVGEVIGNFHPHGNDAIYQTMVGLVQKFSKRYPLLDGQGNWGSVDGDNAAAFRYTEVRMEKIARDMLADIEKQTVDFVPNYDESKVEPVVLPARLPQLLVNGTNGIAVGMATSIPPHNLGEVTDACIALVKNPDMSDEEIFEIIQAPDFPGGGVICGKTGIMQAYKTGHGSVKVRGVVDTEEDSKKATLIIREIPYQVNKADLIERIADLAKNKIVEGITNIRDESARDKMRVVIELKRGESPQIVLNQLYKHTPLKKSISMIMLALLNKRPVVFTLREMLEQFLIHRKVVVRRRTEFELDKTKAREHVLHGLVIALDNIDPVIELIKKSPDAETASNELKAKYALSTEQTKAILEMRLQRITGLEQDKIRAEITELEKVITGLKIILENPSRLIEVVVEELEEIKSKYADKRRTQIEADYGDLSDIDLIPNEEMVVTLTRKGYIKRVRLDVYSVQHRGGKGKRGMMDLSESDDLMEDVFVAQNHDDLLFFTNKGRVYSMKVFQVPEASRIARGRAIVNVLPLGDGERVVKLLCTTGFEDKFLVMVTTSGIIKKTRATAFKKVRSNGIHAINLRDNDELAFCSVSSGTASIVLATSTGQGIRFSETEVRPMGRHSGGVIGIKIKGDGRVVGLEIAESDSELMFATSRGYGKRVRVSDFRVAHRGGLGVRTIPVSKRNGEVIGMIRVEENSTILLIDGAGKIIRLDPQEVRTMRRHAQGVRLIRLDKNQILSSIVSFESDDDDSSSSDDGDGNNSNSGGEIGTEIPEPTGDVMPEIEAARLDAGVSFEEPPSDAEKGSLSFVEVEEITEILISEPEDAEEDFREANVDIFGNEKLDLK
jgi:DNA gyrase subunit A